MFVHPYFFFIVCVCYHKLGNTIVAWRFISCTSQNSLMALDSWFLYMDMFWISKELSCLWVLVNLLQSKHWESEALIEKMTRNYNGFRKLLMVLTKAVKLIALYTVDDRIIWSNLLLSLHAYGEMPSTNGKFLTSLWCARTYPYFLSETSLRSSESDVWCGLILMVMLFGLSVLDGWGQRERLIKRWCCLHRGLR